MNIKIIKYTFVIIFMFILFGCTSEDDIEPSGIYDYYEMDISTYQSVGMEYDFEIGKTKLHFISDGFNQKLSVNNNTFLETTVPYYTLDSTIYQFGDSFAYTVNDKGALYLYDSNIDSVVSYNKFSNYNLKTTLFKISEEGFDIEASAISNNVLSTNDGDIEIDTCEKYNRYKDNIVSANIKVKYLGKSQFEGYKIEKSTKLSEIYKFSSLCN